MTLEGSTYTQRLRVLRDAERLRNVSEECRRQLCVQRSDWKGNVTPSVDVSKPAINLRSKTGN